MCMRVIMRVVMTAIMFVVMVMIMLMDMDMCLVMMVGMKRVMYFNRVLIAASAGFAHSFLILSFPKNRAIINPAL